MCKCKKKKRLGVVSRKEKKCQIDKLSCVFPISLVLQLVWAMHSYLGLEFKKKRRETYRAEPTKVLLCFSSVLILYQELSKKPK